MDNSIQNPRLWGKSSYMYPGKFLGTGNRCGHDPQKPNMDLFSIPKTARDIPHAMKELINGVKHYFFNPQLLPTLYNLTGKRNKDGSLRSNRSDGREGEMLIMAALIHYTDFSSMRVGTPLDDGEFKPRSCVDLAKTCGLAVQIGEDWHPSRRFWRAFTRLKRAGAFDVFETYVVKADGSKRARPAVKLINEDFLISLGVISYKTLKTFRDYASSKIQQARAKFKKRFPSKGDAEFARNKLRLRDAQGRNDPAVKPVKKEPNQDYSKPAKEKPKQDHVEAYNRAKMIFLRSLMLGGESLSPSVAKAKVDREWPPFERWERDNYQ
jgi:hypothetical protein